MEKGLLLAYIFLLTCCIKTALDFQNIALICYNFERENSLNKPIGNVCNYGYIMHNSHRLFVSAFVIASLCIPAQAQSVPAQAQVATDVTPAINRPGMVTSITQFKDVKATDKYYSALRSLVEKYAVIGAYPDFTFRGEQPLSREQFVVLLNNGLDRLYELIDVSNSDTDDKTGDNSDFLINYIDNYDANETQITSISQLKDIPPTYENFHELQSLIERYLIILADKDKKFRPRQAVTEQEFYLWISKIFSADVSGTQSATKPITRGQAVIVFNQALDSVNNRIAERAAAAAKAKEQKQLEEKAKIIRRLPSRGRARIVNDMKFYVRDSGVADVSRASDDLKTAYVDGGVWGEYRIKKGDEGDIVYETTNIYNKKKLVLLRVGTAIVTMQESGIKRIK